MHPTTVLEPLHRVDCYTNTTKSFLAVPTHVSVNQLVASRP